MKITRLSLMLFFTLWVRSDKLAPNQPQVGRSGTDMRSERDFFSYYEVRMSTH